MSETKNDVRQVNFNVADGVYVSLKVYQREIGEWAARNFGDEKGFIPWNQPFMGLVEEVGELSHALLKQWQGIRGTSEEHEASAKDAVGDILVYLFHLCHVKGWDVQDILEDVWSKVGQRNWRKDARTGGEPSNG